MKETKDNIELFGKLRSELDKTEEPISYLMVLNDMWWERYYRKEQVDLPEKVSYKTRKKGRELYIFMELDQIKDDFEWMKLIAELTNLYRTVSTAEEEEDPEFRTFIPLDLSQFKSR